MMQQFNDMNELAEYVGKLEERLVALETENANLRAIQPQSQPVDGSVIAAYVSRSLPQTSLLSPSYIKRAFAVWGHYFVANLLIALVVMVVAFGFSCLFTALFGVSLMDLGR